MPGKDHSELQDAVSEEEMNPPGEHEETHHQVTEQMDGNEDAAQVALAAADELAEAQIELGQHQERIQDLENQLLRRAAEFQNYRRRTQEDLSQSVDRGRAEVAAAMIEVLDDLRRSREAAEQAAAEEQGGPLYHALKDGVDLVYRKFEDKLAGIGVRPMKVVGERFDEDLHEALMQQSVEGHEPGTIVAEIQKGYLIGDRVLRHAQVVVAR